MASNLHRALRAALCLVVTCLTFGMGSSAFAQTADLFISEYIEGSSNNKAIEIYNGTNAPVNLSTGAYKLLQYNNGALTPNLTLALTGTIAPGDVYVVANSGSNAAIIASHMPRVRAPRASGRLRVSRPTRPSVRMMTSLIRVATRGR